MHRFIIILIFLFPVAGIGQTAPHYIHIRSVQFKGNTTTKPQIIEREMTIHAGDSVLSNALTESLDFNKRRILNLQLFSLANYNIKHWVGDSLDIEYDLIEILFWIPRPIFTLADRNFNVWWKEQHLDLSRTNIGLELTRLNFRGRNERIGGTIQLGYNKFFDVYYKIPYVDKKLKRGLGISATYTTGREINFKTVHNKTQFYRDEEYPYRRFQTEFTYTFRPAYALIHEVNLSYNYYSITQDLFNQNPNFLGFKKKVNYLEAKYTVRYNNTDFKVYPINGIDLKTYFSKKGLGLDKDINQTIVYAEISYFRRLWNDVSAAFVFRGRLSWNDKQPYFLNSALGYKNEYVRGYEYYVIDGSHYAIFRGNIRYKLIDGVLHQSLVHALTYIPIRIYAKAFDDVGYAYSKHENTSFLNNKTLNGYGVGIDIVVSYYAKFRIEYSFNHLNQNGLFLHGSKE